MPVKILTDSTSYIPESIRKELDIRQVSLTVSFGGKHIRETDMDNLSFYQLMAKQGVPKSSQPSVGELYEEMIQVAEAGDSLCGIFLSAEMSGTYSSALMAKGMVLEKVKDAQIEILDSRSNCMQLGFAVLTAARGAKAGKSLGEVKEAVLANIQRSRFLFIPDSLEYLKKGGRIGGAEALLGNLFKIIPILTVENGKTTVLTKVRTKEKATGTMLEIAQKDIQEHGLGELIVHHIDSLREAQELAYRIEEKLKIKPDILDIGPVIGLHVGPGTVAVAYYTENALR